MNSSGLFVTQVCFHELHKTLYLQVVRVEPEVARRNIGFLLAALPALASLALVNNVTINDKHST